MPTGYTAAIKDGIDFPTFVIRCARAFGALVLMRDDPPDAAIYEFKPAKHCFDWVKAAEAEVRRLDAMSIDEAAKAQSAQLAQRRDYRANDKAEREKLRSAYVAMLAQVEAWEPPTPDHGGLKEFMRDQIQQSIRFDCELGADVGEIFEENPAFWLGQQKREAAKELERAKKDLAEEIKRTSERNAWVEALRESLSAEAKR